MTESIKPSTPRVPSLVPPPAVPTPMLRLERFIETVGEMSLMVSQAFSALFHRPFEGREIIRQIHSLGLASMGIVTVTSVFIGMVMAAQFAFGLQKFGGMEYTGRVVALSFARELAPTLTAIIVAGRIGAGMTAELGSMAVTEQIDAIQALGADPIKKLVAPRLIASIIVMPILGSYALLLGFVGAMFITDWQFGIPASFFLSSALNSMRILDYLAGLIKTPFFGAVIAIIACHFGIKTTGGTAGVGKNTTRTVVATSIVILILDFFLTKFVFIFWSFG
jgi:phospholipid/cholesterol/gamma-HCH transport system permease protein